MPLRRLETQAVLRRHPRHHRISEREGPEQRTPDRVGDYRGAEITIHFNRLQCASALECVHGLPAVFKKGGKPWITPDNATAEQIMAAIGRCPSGALRYTVNDATGRSATSRRASTSGTTVPMRSPAACRSPRRTGAKARRREHYTLCRCGASRNKPFCDGSHWRINFLDEGN